MLISAIVITGDMLSARERGVRSEMFSEDAGIRPMWDWLVDYFEEYRDVPTEHALAAEFPRFELIDTDETAWAADAVVNRYGERMMAEAIRRASGALRAGDTRGALALVRQTTDQVNAALESRATLRSSVHDVDATYEAAKRSAEAASHNGTAGITTGFPCLDDRFGGMRGGHLGIVAARSGNTKTWLLLKLAALAAMAGYRVHFWSLEQSKEQIDYRAHVYFSHLLDSNTAGSNTAGMRVSALTTGKGLDLLEYRRLLRRIKSDVPGDLRVFVQGRERVTPRTVSAAIERDQPELVLIDYMTLMDANDAGDRDWRAVGSIARDLKRAAVAYDIPVVAANQINREGIGRKPPRSDNLSEADGIKHAADWIVTMVKQSTSVVELLLDKNRHGPDNHGFWARFKPDWGIYEHCTYSDAQDLLDEDREAEEEL